MQAPGRTCSGSAPAPSGCRRGRACGQGARVKAPVPAFLPPLSPPARLLGERPDYRGLLKQSRVVPRLKILDFTTSAGSRFWGPG